MILVAIASIALTAWTLVVRALDPLLIDRSGTLPAVWIGGGGVRYLAVAALIAGLVATPFALATSLALGSSPLSRSWRRVALRWVEAAACAALGLAILNFPLDGIRVAWPLADGSTVAFYHQYRLWPGEHVTPCLELTTPAGKSRPYPIAKNTRYRETPEPRTDAEQTMVWFIDRPGATVRYSGVWCAIDRTTSRFIGAGGPYPAGVNENSGFPPTRRTLKGTEPAAPSLPSEVIPP